MRVRKDVGKLPAGDRTLEWYGKAVGAMQDLPVTDPLSWSYQGAIHGLDTIPPELKKWWGQCQHSTSFFVPWHRMYLLHFERIVAANVQALGGPADWALPYWNYSESSDFWALPPAFTAETLADGSRNPLYVAQRGEGVNANERILDARDVDLVTCLRAAPDTSETGFFGAVPANHLTRAPEHYFGRLELTPHNTIHNKVGGDDGWMADPDLAALDPIFWLHHSNIDRLWEVWLKRDERHHNLTTELWLHQVKFHFHDAGGKPVTMKVADILDLSSPLLDYGYEDTQDPLTPTPELELAAPRTFTMVKTTPELAGATTAPVILAAKVVHSAVPTPVTPLAFRVAAMPESVSAFAPSTPPSKLVQQVTLRLEQVTSASTSATYDVFLNVPVGEDHAKHDESFIARVAMFGIGEASAPGGSHGGGGGQSFAFDITEIYHRLADKGEIDGQNLHVSFVPVMPGKKGDVSIGRIGLYFA
jgi:tyrosinase